MEKSFLTIGLPVSLRNSVLALGSHRKNTICFAQDNFALISRIHQDLENPDDFRKFKKVVEYLLKRKPKIIACDLHPEYLSTKYAHMLFSDLSAIREIQHHHSHLAGAMALAGIRSKKVIGVIFDGTGFGLDNTLWGGEFFIGNYRKFLRAAFIKPIELPGGAKAIKEPWRVAFSWLLSLYGKRAFNLGIPLIKKINPENLDLVERIKKSGFNSPLSSGAGRLFDAAASLILLKPRAGFEAELPIELERLAASGKQKYSAYKINICKENDNLIWDPALVFKGIVSDIIVNKPKAEIAFNFHFTVAEAICRICTLLSKEYAVKTVVLSGGVFQNNLLLSLTRGLLYKSGFREVFADQNWLNDSGISLGQAVLAGR